MKVYVKDLGGTSKIVDVVEASETGAFVAKAGDTMTGMLAIQIAASNIQADYIQLKPTDFAANKPYLFIQKTTTADKWAIGLWDGSDIDGTIDFAVTTLTRNSNTIIDVGNIFTLAERLGVVRGIPDRTNSTLVLADAGQSVFAASGSACTVTVPPASSVAWVTGTYVNMFQEGVGQLTITPGSGVTLSSYNGALKLTGRYAMATLLYVGADSWRVGGNLVT